MAQQAFLVNQYNCIGCHACEMGCKQQWQTELNWRHVRHFEGGRYPNPVRLYLSLSCQHCEEPFCAQACPTKRYIKRDFAWMKRQPWIKMENGSISVVTTLGKEYEVPRKLLMAGERFFDDGLVIYNDVSFGEEGRGDYSNHRCILCGLCEVQCPYHVPKLNDKPTDGCGNRWEKCMGCYPRLQQGLPPVCSQVCMGLALDMMKLKDLEADKGLIKEVPGFKYEDTKPCVRFKPLRPVLPDNIIETGNL